MYFFYKSFNVISEFFTSFLSMFYALIQKLFGIKTDNIEARKCIVDLALCVYKIQK